MNHEDLFQHRNGKCSHQPSSEKVRKHEDLFQHRNGKCSCHQPSSEKGWEEEFDERFVVPLRVFNGAAEESVPNIMPSDIPLIKSFISSVLAQQRENVLEVVRGLRNNVLCVGCSSVSPEGTPHREACEAISDVEYKISKL